MKWPISVRNVRVDTRKMDISADLYLHRKRAATVEAEISPAGKIVVKNYLVDNDDRFKEFDKVCQVRVDKDRFAADALQRIYKDVQEMADVSGLDVLRYEQNKHGKLVIFFVFFDGPNQIKSVSLKSNARSFAEGVRMGRHLSSVVH